MITSLDSIISVWYIIALLWEWSMLKIFSLRFKELRTKLLLPLLVCVNSSILVAKLGGSGLSGPTCIGSKCHSADCGIISKLFWLLLPFFSKNNIRSKVLVLPIFGILLLLNTLLDRRVSVGLSGVSPVSCASHQCTILSLVSSMKVSRFSMQLFNLSLLGCFLNLLSNRDEGLREILFPTWSDNPTHDVRARVFTPFASKEVLFPWVWNRNVLPSCTLLNRYLKNSALPLCLLTGTWSRSIGFIKTFKASVQVVENPWLEGAIVSDSCPSC